MTEAAEGETKRFDGLTAGLVGVGPWGANILRDLRQLGATVHAVARSEASIERARRGGAATVTSHPRDLPQSCDGFVIANRTVSHVESIRDLLDRDRPIFCEKPLAVDPRQVLDLPQRAHGRVFVMHKWRYHPGILKIAEIARERELGPVEGLRTVRVGWYDNHPDTTPLWVLAPHDLSIALEILGEVPTLAGAFPDPLQAMGRSAIAHLQTRDGLPVIIEVSARQPVARRSTILKCRGGVAALCGEDYTKVVIQREGDEKTSDIRVSGAMPLLVELEAFLAHLSGGPPPHTALSQEIEIVRTIADIERALLDARR